MRLLALFLLSAGLALARDTIRVLAWSERSEPQEVYPDGINGALAQYLNREQGFTAHTACLADAEQGLSEETLGNTDVLIWFGHRYHRQVESEAVDRIVRQVRERGMGFLALHSSHFALPFQRMMEAIASERGITLDGEPGRWRAWRNAGLPERIHVVNPRHPITRDVRDFTIPRTETYFAPFMVPPPDAMILEGRYEGGAQDGQDGLLWFLGNGRIFYFRPGQETYPIFFQPEVRHVLRNAVRYLASGR